MQLRTVRTTYMTCVKSGKSIYISYLVSLTVLFLKWMMIKSTSHRRIRLAIGIRVMESFGETRSFFSAQHSIRTFKNLRHKKAPTHRASAYRSETYQTPTSNKNHNQKPQPKTTTNITISVVLTTKHDWWKVNHFTLNKLYLY